jgi:hypothetical protein
MKKKILSVMASALFAIAATTVSTASLFVVIYQPKTPKCLNK